MKLFVVVVFIAALPQLSMAGAVCSSEAKDLRHFKITGHTVRVDWTRSQVNGNVNMGRGSTYSNVTGWFINDVRLNRPGRAGNSVLTIYRNNNPEARITRIIMGPVLRPWIGPVLGEFALYVNFRDQADFEQFRTLYFQDQNMPFIDPDPDSGLRLFMLDSRHDRFRILQHLHHMIHFDISVYQEMGEILGIAQRSMPITGRVVAPESNVTTRIQPAIPDVDNKSFSPADFGGPGSGSNGPATAF